MCIRDRNEHFTVYLPFYCEYPYGVYIMANRHVQYITDLTEEEKYTLGVTIRDTVGMLDSLFDYRFPYMMCTVSYTHLDVYKRQA